MNRVKNIILRMRFLQKRFLIVLGGLFLIGFIAGIVPIKIKNAFVRFSPAETLSISQSESLQPKILYTIPEKYQNSIRNFFSKDEEITYKRGWWYGDLVIFSPNFERFIIKVKTPDEKELVIIDGKESEKYELILEAGFLNNGKDFYYFGGNKCECDNAGCMCKETYFILNNKKTFAHGILIDIGQPNILKISLDSKRFAYVARKDYKKDYKYVVVLDGRELGEYDYVTNLNFSPDNKRFGYIATEKEKKFVVIDGKKGKQYDDIRNLIFSPDSKHFAYIGHKNGKDVVVLNNKELSWHNRIYDLKFSPNSKYFAYVAQRGGKEFVVLNGKELKKFDYIGKSPYADSEPSYRNTLTFSPDSKHLAYWAGLRNKEFLVLNQRIINRCDVDTIRALIAINPVFAPNSKSVAYRCIRKGKEFIALNNKEFKKYEWVHIPIFSPDSKNLAYWVGKNCEAGGDVGEIWSDCKEEFIVLNNSEGKKYNDVFTPKFSPNSKHLVYRAVIEERPKHKWFLVIDDKILGPYDYVSDPIFSSDSKYLIFGAKKDKEILKVVNIIE